MSESARTYNVGVIPGDGVGIEVTAEALKAIDAAASRFGFTFSPTNYDLGGTRYLSTGEVLPESVQDELADQDAILLGAVGTPDVPPGVLERGLLLKLRFDFDQYINLRPVKLYPGVPSPIAGLTPERCDMVIVRENTEGMYSGFGGSFKKGTPYEITTQESVNTRHGAERAIRYAFDRAMERDRRLTVCHKTNVLNYAAEMWWRIANELNEEYPDVALDYVHVDAACLHLINAPERFDVMVTDNLFGDIVTDVGAAIQGGLGLASSANLNPDGDYPSMFEPVHGSAPDIAGQGWANPVAAVISAAMCLNELGEPEAAVKVEESAAAVLPELSSMGGPDMGMSTSQVGDRIVELINS